MKIACSSASFESALTRGECTHLEWLDICANELEVDGVVLEMRHFPRTDAEYLAQVKKGAADLGLTVAAVGTDDLSAPGATRALETAVALGAPLLAGHAAAASEQAGAWTAFTAGLKLRASEAKRANVTLALRPQPNTQCTDVDGLLRASKDVDSAWLRYALDEPSLNGTGAGTRSKTAIAFHAIADLERFATAGDDEAASLARGLARFRGFVTIDASAEPGSPRDAYHRALERFVAMRCARLAHANA